MRHLISATDLTPVELERIFTVTQDLKAKHASGLREALLPGRVMALIFEKPSLRTRVSFESGMNQLGGSSIMLGRDAGFGSRESIEDFSRVISQYVDVVVVRANRHQSVVDLAKHCTCSVINGLTDVSHPCQAMADIYTLRELIGGRLNGLKLAYVGDANNVARSLAEVCAMVGMEFVVARPDGYGFEPDFATELKRQFPDAKFSETADPQAAVRNAVAVYTDVWASMGQEAETEKRKADFANYQINAQLMSHAPNDAFFMHCLPAHRGEEVTNEVIDSPQSVVIQQAGNRMHVQKGILAWLLGRKN